MKNKKGFKVVNIIMKIISWCVMAILIVIGVALLSVVVLNKIADIKGEPSPIGLYTIISPSMTPKIAVYDVVVVVRKDPKEIKEGDIISYYSTNAMLGDIPVTHRVVEKFNTNAGITFRTKGDANPVVDNEIIFEERVIGTVRFVIPKLGRVQFFLASRGGWFIAILVPALGIIIYDIFKLSKLLRVKNKMKYVSELSEEENITHEKTAKKLEAKKHYYEEEKKKEEKSLEEELEELEKEINSANKSRKRKSTEYDKYKIDSDYTPRHKTNEDVKKKRSK